MVFLYLIILVYNKRSTLIHDEVNPCILEPPFAVCKMCMTAFQVPKLVSHWAGV